MSSKKVLGLCAALALLSSAKVYSATFFADQFNYVDGDLTVVGGAGNNVSGGAWVPFSGTGFPAESIKVISGQAQAKISNSEDATRAIPNEGTAFMTAGETWYYGALVTVNDQRATPATTAIVNDYFLLVKDTTTTNFRSRMYVNGPSTGLGGAGFRLGIGASSGAGNAVNWGTDLAFGQKYLVIASYEFDTGFAKMWVNPVNVGSTSVTATLSPSPATFISQLSIRQAFNSGGVSGGPGVPNTQMLLDAVTLGNSFADVRAALVPEPASAALGLMGLVGLALGRRARRS